MADETCVHCGCTRMIHCRPFFTCPSRSTFFETGPTREQLADALARAEAKIARLYARGVDTTAALNDERDFLHAFIRLAVSVDADTKAILVRMHDAMSAYFEHYGAEHEDGCPEDDTCECELVGAVNEAFAAALRI